ncbi:MAG: heme exporter protein CcmB [Anaerolineales bacterium]
MIERARPALQPLATSGDRARHYARTVAAIVWKDLAAELRSKELISAMVVFALLMILIFNFALELDLSARENVAAGVLWVTTVFTGTLGLNRSLAAEKDRGSLDGLLLAPMDRSALYFGKALGNLLFILIVEAIILPVFNLLFNVAMVQPLVLLIVLLGSLGYAAVGTLLASLAIHSRSRDVMLPILLLPVAVPLLIAAVRATGAILVAAGPDEINPWINLLLVYDVIFVAVAFMVFEVVVEE